MDDQVWNRKISNLCWYLYLINEHWTLCPISQECSCLLPRRKNSCLPDVSVHQIQPTWSYSITKNVHFSIFSLSSLSDVSIHHLQPTWSYSITKNVQSLIITTNNPIGHTQSKRMFSLSSSAGQKLSYYWLSQSKVPFAVASIFQSQRNERAWMNILNQGCVYVPLVESLLERDIYSCSVLILPHY